MVIALQVTHILHVGLKNEINSKLRNQLQESRHRIGELEEQLEAKRKDRLELTAGTGLTD